RSPHVFLTSFMCLTFLPCDKLYVVASLAVGLRLRSIRVARRMEAVATQARLLSQLLFKPRTQGLWIRSTLQLPHRLTHQEAQRLGLATTIVRNCLVKLGNHLTDHQVKLTM